METTQTDTNVELSELFDWDIECQAVDPECSDAAEWVMIVNCDCGSYFFCSPHLERSLSIIRDLGDAVGLNCSECRLPVSPATIVRRIEKIK